MLEYRCRKDLQCVVVGWIANVTSKDIPGIYFFIDMPKFPRLQNKIYARMVLNCPGGSQECTKTFFSARRGSLLCQDGRTFVNDTFCQETGTIDVGARSKTGAEI